MSERGGAWGVEQGERGEGSVLRFMEFEILTEHSCGQLDQA